MTEQEMTHAHVLFEAIAAHPEGLTQDELQAVAASEFGADATYTNCSGQAYNFEEIVQFFFDRQKVVKKDNGKLVLNTGNICSH